MCQLVSPNLWISHYWDYRYASVSHRYLKGNQSENQSVSGMTTICLMQHSLLRIELIRPVECCPTPLQWLCEGAGYWRELEHPV
jgi:hypothetical protein